MAITTVDGLVAAFPGQIASILRRNFTPQAVGAYHSLWLESGIPGPGAAPSSGVAGDVPTDATAGAIPFTNPGGGNLSYLGRLSMAASQNGVLYLYDRLLHNSGISASSTSAQTLNTTALTRPDALGAGVEAWWQVYATMGAGGSNIPTLSYTDQDGNAGATASVLVALAATMTAGRSGQFTLAAGDSGVRSVQSWTNSASMTSGTIGLVLRRQVACIPVGYVVAAQQVDAFGAGLPRIYDDACLEWLWYAGIASATNVHGQIQIVQG